MPMSMRFEMHEKIQNRGEEGGMRLRLRFQTKGSLYIKLNASDRWQLVYLNQLLVLVSPAAANDEEADLGPLLLW